MTKVIVAGSRSCPDNKINRDNIRSAILSFGATEIVSGKCKTGADAIGESLALELGIPLKIFRADWDKHRKAAGPIRNREMAKYADVLILIWDGRSKGSLSMLHEASYEGLQIIAFPYSMG